MAAAAANEPKLVKTLAPLPATRRGYGIVLNSTKDQRIVYTNGRLVIVRSLANPSDAVTFSEHKAAVSAAVFSPSGYWVASGDVEGNVIIWSWPQMKVKNTFQIAKSITDLDWDADGTRIVAGGDGVQKARVFSWDSGNNLGEITMHSQPVISCSYRKVRPFRVATGSEDLAVNMYEGPPFKYKEAYKGHTRYPNCVRYSPDGSRFASVGSDSRVVVYDGSTGTVLVEADDKHPNNHKGAIFAFAWSPDSKSILTASADKTAKIWAVGDKSLEVQTTFTFGNDTQDQQLGALWTADFIVTVSLSGAINYLDVSNPAAPKRVLHGHQSSIQSLALDIPKGLFYTAGLSGEVCKWDFATGDAKWLGGKGHGGKVVVSVLLSSDGSTLYTLGMDDQVRASPVESNQVSADGGDLGGQPVAGASSPTDPGLVAAVLAQEKVVLARKGQVVHTTNLGFAPTTVRFSGDGATLVVGGKDKKLHLYEVGKDVLKAVSKTIDTHDKPLTSISFSDDGRFIVSTDQEASVYLHDWASAGKDLKNRSGWRFHQAAVRDASFAPGSAVLATAANDGAIIVWRDLKEFNGSERAKAKDAHVDGVFFVRFWDATTLVSAGGDRCVRVWNI